MKLPFLLDRFLEAHAIAERRPAKGGLRILVAFSGGPDSTALLYGLTRLARKRSLELHAAHFDHGLDPESADRAAIAARLCAQLEVPLVCRRASPEGSTKGAVGRSGESPEAAARRMRYRFLEETRERVGARWIATAHHREDQIETLLLRIQCGTGIEGLSGIAARRGRIIRPLLEAPRSLLRQTLEESDLEPADDPTNRDLSRPRNRMRWAILPRLTRADPRLPESVLRVATAATASRLALAATLSRALAPRVEPPAVVVSRSRLAALPLPLWPAGLAALHRLAGADYPPREASRRELRRQLDNRQGVGCDCGDGWRWSGRGEALKLSRHTAKTADFTYTLQVPGEVEIPELGLFVRLSRGPIAAWMFRGSSTRSGMALPIATGDRLTIRNRRPGDRIRPLGCRHRRRLKDVLIDRRIPRQERDKIPLLCLGDRVAWVPGVTIDEAYRLESEGQTWLVELIPT